MSEESPWSTLGSNVLGGNRIEELKALVQSIHRELMGSVEGLGRRVGALESSLTDFDAKMNLLIKAVDRLETLPTAQMPKQQMSIVPEAPIDNLLMVMSAEELGIERTAEELEPVDDGVESISVKGFVAPPPAETEQSLPTEAAECADAIYKFLTENPGVQTNHWKTRNLIDKGVDSKTRKEIRGILQEKGVRSYKVSQFADWMFIGDEDPQQHYEKHNA